ncbi:peptide deformylase [Eubacterium oxidoreducens]|uniref:Peptide deformylase n=1 Tax=Eubacterium oxidoreducens TaxID=1732 RepID=A0A1G6B5Y0_EUBOX|nr:peptide deformylase [Eubacterium oxidoreducens]SDB16078.1 peptide deformylase [Eubacterium oxidoreducens]
MALREIRILGDPVLEKVSREVKEITPRIQELIVDMLETMYDAAGVGLAAVQVGVLRRVVVIDCGIDPLTGEEAEYGECAVVMINPRIIETSGEQTGDEGCLSYPGKAGIVTRPDYVKAVYYDEEMNECEIVGEGLLARAICHELDHLDGHMYVEKVEGEVHDVQYADPSEEEE